jgi:hypothetical protein
MTQLRCPPSFRSLERDGMVWEGLLGTQYNTSPGELSGLPSAMLPMCSHCWGVTEPEPRRGPPNSMAVCCQSELSVVGPTCCKSCPDPGSTSGRVSDVISAAFPITGGLHVSDLWCQPCL